MVNKREPYGYKREQDKPDIAARMSLVLMPIVLVLIWAGVL